MKSLNHTCVEKLPFLLGLKEGDSYQTIRKAWHKCAGCEQIGSDGIHTKPPKYKVGDKVNLVWNRDSRAEYFCKRHGNPIITNYSNIDKKFSIDWIIAKNFRFGKECNCTPPVIYHEMRRELFDNIFFNKNLGTVEITKREIILIRKEGNNYFCLRRKNKRESWTELNIGETQELAEKDGMGTFRKLCEYFEREQNIDFTSNKEFWRYTGVVL